MATFELKSQLNYEDQVELNRIIAIPSANRNDYETMFYNSRIKYELNRVLCYDLSRTEKASSTSDPIIEAEGNYLPEGYAGFKQGAIFRKLNKTGMNVYINTGTATTAVWSQLNGQVVSASVSPSPSLSESRSASLSASLSNSRSPSLSLSRSPSLSASPSSSDSLSSSPSPSLSLSRSPSLSASPSASVSPSATNSPSPSASESRSASRSASPSSSESPSDSPSPSFPFV